MDKQALQRMIQTAYNAGCPRDQVETFLKANSVVLPKQWLFHAQARKADLPDGPTDIGIGGSRGGSKSHAVLAQAAIDDCQRMPNLKVLFLRQTGKAAQESFDDLILKVLTGHIPFKRTKSTIKLDNGSNIVLGGFKTASDIDKYVGIEYDIIIVEELNQLTEDKYTKLRGSLRTSKAGWRPRMYVSFNPGGPGHTLVRDRYVKKQAEGCVFIPMNYKDNPFLNPEYITYLVNLEGDLGRAWRDGDFDVFQGQVFSELRETTHSLKPMLPSKKYPHVLWMDWGYSSSKKTAFSALMTTIIDKTAPDGQNYKQLITYKEWCGNLKEPQEWARIIYEDCVKMDVRPIHGVSDPAMHAPLQDGSSSIAKQMMREWKKLFGEQWVTIKKGGNSGGSSRVNRVGMMHGWLAINPASGLPYWMITSNCKNFWDYVPPLTYDETLTEAYAKDGEENMADAASYGLSRITFMSVQPGSYSFKSKKESKSIKFNYDGQQIPFTSNDFAKMYTKEDGIIKSK